MRRRALVLAWVWASGCAPSLAKFDALSFTCRTTSDCLTGWRCELNVCVASLDPGVLSVRPPAGPIGTLLTLEGGGVDYRTVTALRIGTIAQQLVATSAESMRVLVMPGTTGGSIELTTTGGVASSKATFTVTTSTAPTRARGGAMGPTQANASAEPSLHSVAVSADGAVLLVGRKLFDNAMIAGAAWVYTRRNDAWISDGPPLEGSGLAGAARLGFAVALSADGTTAAVGGHGDDGAVGATWVFTRGTSGWAQQGPKLVGSAVAGIAAQGEAVALSADGSTLIVGGPIDAAAYPGAAWVFVRRDGAWAQQGPKLVPNDHAGRRVLFGSSVAMSADGNTALIGGQGFADGAGAAWVFTRTDGTWAQQGARLVGSGGTSTAAQGYSVALNADASIALVGGRGDRAEAGTVWAFERSALGWTERAQTLRAADAVGLGQHGSSVAVNAEGSLAAIGSPADDGSVGGMRFFERDGLDWSQVGERLVGTGGGTAQGHSAALSSDGSTLVVGGAFQGTGNGAVWLFTR